MSLTAKALHARFRTTAAHGRNGHAAKSGGSCDRQR